jgi:hypothetical protein
MTVVYRISHAPEPALHARSVHGCPMVIGDTMAPVQSMLDGKLYDSKAALRATYRAAGVTEVGNDPAIYRRKAKPKPDRQAIKAAVNKAFSRAGFGA